MIRKVVIQLLRYSFRTLSVICICLTTFLLWTDYEHSVQLPSEKLLAVVQNSNQEDVFSSKPRASLNATGTRQNYFVYVKVEKTGSSTFSNIFSSYGYRHNLNMMMSTIKGSLVNTREMEPGGSWDIGPDRSNPHILEQHARYNHNFFTKNFPNQTVYITSIRDPVKWFISFVDFMSAYKSNSPVEVLDKPKLFYKTRNFVTGMQRQVHNNFLQWLGFDVYKSDDIQAIKDYIEFVDRRFKLVMITDYFDESLVLLRRLMNWSMADIFYSYANEAKRRSGTVFTQQQKDKLLDSGHNLGDWMLYQHFNKSFWKKISQQPEFFDEVTVFKELNPKVQEFCLGREIAADKKVKLELSTRWEKEPFYFGEKDCLAIRVKDGVAEQFSSALDKYCPFRSSKSVKDLKFK